MLTLRGFEVDKQGNKVAAYLTNAGNTYRVSIEDVTNKLKSHISIRNACLVDDTLSIKLSPSKKNLKDCIFGQWTVIEYIGGTLTNKDGRWLCRCSCGKLVAVNQKSLLNKESTSCGHNTTGFIDLKDKQVCDWHVDSYAGDGYWNCTCSCGTKRQVFGKSLKLKTSTSCGHDTNAFVDLTEQKIGQWHVKLYKGNDMWECECSCGTIRDVSGHSLKRNLSLSCGHDTNSFIDLKGEQFYDWTVIEYAGNRKWLCECSCGAIRLVAGYTLLNGTSKSCGHDTNAFIDLTDYQFDELYVKSYAGNSSWNCRCSCDKSLVVPGYQLRNGLKKSCGHLKVDIPYPYNTAENFAIYLVQLEASLGRKPHIGDIVKDINLCKSSVGKYIHKYQLEDFVAISDYTSLFEQDICDFLVQHNIRIETSNRDLIKPYELDIYLPGYNIAIECNGTYWHSTEKKDKYYHIHKTNLCNKQGIRLVHIFEYEWQNEKQQYKIKNFLLSLLSNSKKIYARNTEIRYPSQSEVHEFLIQNHLQGDIGYSIAVGLYSNNTLVQLATFGTPRFDNNANFELIRLCTRQNYVVIGGASKLFAYFTNNHMTLGQKLVSYCDLSKFTGKVYENLGMQLKHVSAPNYVYASNSGQVLTRYQCQKHRLVEQGFDASLTEEQIMLQRGFNKIYDCGNAVYVYELIK